MERGKLKDFGLLESTRFRQVVFRYTKLGYAGNSEPQFILPSGKKMFWISVLSLLFSYRFLI